MAPKKPLVVVTRKLPDVIETRMMELFDARLNLDDTPLTQAQLVAAVQQADVLVPTITDRIDAAVLAQAGPRLKLIASFGTGVDHIDIASARTRGITVTNTPAVLTEDTADMTMALILAASRRVSEGERLIRGGKWAGWGPTFMLGHRLWGKRLGIVGMGRIDQMLARVDIVSVNCPHTPATYHLLSARRLKLLRPHCVVVNTARGEVIDEDALTRMLMAHEIAGAGLDVFEHEPAVSPKLLKLDSVVLLPHMGSATIEGRIDMGEKVIINIKTFADGHRPPDRVLETML